MALAMRFNLRNPDGRGVSFALMPYATLPTGGDAIGAGDWSAGVRIPMSFDLGGVALALTPQIKGAVDEDRHGRHLNYGGVAGLGIDLSENVSTTAELSLHRDLDPAGHGTEALGGLSLAWKANADTQWDAGINMGLNSNSPGVELYAGVVRRF